MTISTSELTVIYFCSYIIKVQNKVYNRMCMMAPGYMVNIVFYWKIIITPHFFNLMED